MTAANAPTHGKKSLHTWGIFFSLSGFGGLFSIWAAGSVYTFLHLEPWPWVFAAILAGGLGIYTQGKSLPTPKKYTQRHFPNQ
jgi:hypothetical protein